jgi:very-short-patch-repair endonuclease
MKRKKEDTEFRCSMCKEEFRGLDSFHGEYRVMRGVVKNVQLCLKCLYETTALWGGEFNSFRGQIKREIENCIRQHRRDKNADAKRTAYEKVLDLIDSSVMFNGYNERSGYGRDLSGLELDARRMIHGTFKINFEEQIRLGGGQLVDGLIPLEKNPIVLEFDGWRHGIDEQKERDKKKDNILTMYRYKVLRFPEKTIQNDRSQIMTLILDAFYNMKRNNNKKIEITQLAESLTST